MEIIVLRDTPVSHETRSLPAAEYNLARLLQSRSANGIAFVPIRAMQMLAILDAEEFVFVDAQHKQVAVLAWQDFRPQLRASLADPVPFQAACYRADVAEIQRRLQPELFKAMRALAAKGSITGPARILKFERPPSGKAADPD